ncbi:class I SAM-dependent methyltransferase [Rhodobacteraceae bacterium NNCM2]|nr:class I SAM-dependent methyltransferase [Coraliihabitans acroporae]
MRILVAIANHGTSNNHFVQRLIEEYRSFSHDVSIVILSNIDKDLGPDIEVAVGAPTDNPWSLPFAHKQIFFDRQDDHDLFIYSEDDTLITEENITAFLEAEAALPPDHIAGFIRHEIDTDGEYHYSTVHGSYHWDPASVIPAGGEVYASYTNEHSAAFILSRDKLKACIASGGFMCEAHEGRYDMLCSAATDPYTRCGLHKVICVSAIDRFSLHHLPNKYIGKIGVPKAEIDLQLKKIREIASGSVSGDSLLNGRAKVSYTARYDRVYFSSPTPSIAEVMPQEPCRVLSIGCDCGRAEEELTKRGHEVDAIPLDYVIAASARMRGVNILNVDLTSPAQALPVAAYDILLFNFCLPFVEDPSGIIRQFAPALRDGGRLVTPFWNWQSVREQVRRHRERRVSPEASTVGAFGKSGIHRTDQAVVRRWLSDAGFGVERTVFDVRASGESLSRFSLGILDPWMATTGSSLSTPRRS